MPASDLEELKSFVRSFCAERDWEPFHSVKNLSIGLITEAAELLEPFRFRSDDECRELLSQTLPGRCLSRLQSQIQPVKTVGFAFLKPPPCAITVDPNSLGSREVGAFYG